MIGPPLDPIERRGREDLGLRQSEARWGGSVDRDERQVVCRLDMDDQVAPDLDHGRALDHGGRDHRGPVGLELEGEVDDGRAVPAEVQGDGPHRDSRPTGTGHGGKRQGDSPGAVRPRGEGGVPERVDLSPRSQKIDGHALHVAVGPADGVGMGRTLGRCPGIGRVEREDGRVIVPREEVDPDRGRHRVPGHVGDAIEEDFVLRLEKERRRRIEGDGPAVCLKSWSDRNRTRGGAHPVQMDAGREAPGCDQLRQDDDRVEVDPDLDLLG